jgi:hypothetical protein
LKKQLTSNLQEAKEHATAVTDLLQQVMMLQPPMHQLLRTQPSCRSAADCSFVLLPNTPLKSLFHDSVGPKPYHTQVTAAKRKWGTRQWLYDVQRSDGNCLLLRMRSLVLLP